MSLNHLLTGGVLPLQDISVDQLTSNSFTTNAITTGSVTATSVSAASVSAATIIGTNIFAGKLKIESLNQAVTVKNLNGLVGPVYDPSPLTLLSGAMYYLGPGALTFRLPTQASVVAFLASQGIPFTFNIGFNFNIVNASASTITISNALDLGIQLLAGSTNFVQPANSNVSYTWLFNNPAGSYVIG